MRETPWQDGFANYALRAVGHRPAFLLGFSIVAPLDVCRRSTAIATTSLRVHSWCCASAPIASLVLFDREKRRFP